MMSLTDLGKSQPARITREKAGAVVKIHELVRVEARGKSSANFPAKYSEFVGELLAVDRELSKLDLDEPVEIVVESSVNGIAVTLPLSVIPADFLRDCAVYGMSKRMQDAYAGQKDIADVEALAKLSRVLFGTTRARAKRVKAETWQRVALDDLRALVDSFVDASWRPPELRKAARVAGIKSRKACLALQADFPPDAETALTASTEAARWVRTQLPKLRASVEARIRPQVPAWVTAGCLVDPDTLDEVAAEVAT